MIVTTSDNQIYLVELSPPFKRLQFQFVPQNIPWDRTGNWVNIPIVGRNNSKKQFTGGEDKISLSLDFNASFEKDKEICVKQFYFLKSLVMNDGNQGPARNVKLIWGLSNLFRHKVWIIRTVRGDFSLFHSGFGMNPMQATIQVDMEMDPEENERLSDVRLLDLNDDFEPANDNPFNNTNVA